MSRFVENFQGEQVPLLARRQPRGKAIADINVSKPTDKQNIDYLKRLSLDPTPVQSSSSSTKSKLSLKIPQSEGRKATYVRTIPHTSNPILQDGVVADGSFDRSPSKSREAAREEWIQALQWSGDRGWNDYLHWNKHHPHDQPFKSFDMCHCDFEKVRKNQDLAYQKYWEDIQEERQTKQKKEVERTFIDHGEYLEFRCDTAEEMSRLEMECDDTSSEDGDISCVAPSPLTTSRSNTGEEQTGRGSLDIAEMKRRVAKIRKRAREIANRKTRDEVEALLQAEREQEQRLLLRCEPPHVNEESSRGEWSTCAMVFLAVLGLVAFVDGWLLIRELLIENLH